LHFGIRQFFTNRWSIHPPGVNGYSFPAGIGLLAGDYLLNRCGSFEGDFLCPKSFAHFGESSLFVESASFIFDGLSLLWCSPDDANFTGFLCHWISAYQKTIT
jgi:hypothetical protein